MSQSSRTTQIAVIGVFAAIIVGVLIAVSAGDSDEGSGGDAGSGGFEPTGLFDGIAQRGTVLGDPAAGATLIEFGDLQCPFCADFSRDVLPSVVEDYVQPGRLKLDFQVLTFLGADSVEAGRMAAAVGLQDRIWDFVEIFYANQGAENSGYVDETFLTEIARAIPGLDVDRALADRDSPEVDRWLAEAESAAASFEINSTPSFVLTAPGEDPRPLELSSLDPDEFTAALDEALAAAK